MADRRRTQTADHLAARIDYAVMEAVAELNSSYGLGTSEWGYEEPAQTDRPDDEWPIIVTRLADSTRYSVDVQVTVNPLGALVDDQQPAPGRTYRTRRRNPHPDTPLTFRDDEPPCSVCGVFLVLGWVDFPSTPNPRGPRRHANCQHLAVMRASHPEWFPDTAAQLPLIPEETHHA